MNILDLAQQKVQLKKVASTHGGEWHGPCPSCGGTDRFHVWPEQNEGQGGYWCRACGKAGDAIQFLRDFDGKTFQEACAFLNIHIEEKDYRPPAPKRKPEFHPVEHKSPAELWQDRAEKFVSWAQEQLQKNKQVLEWLAARGINQESVEYSRLGWNPGENGKDIYRPRKAWGLPEIKNENGKQKAIWIPVGLVIPYIIDGIIYRIRIRRPEDQRTEDSPLPYYIFPGSSMATMIIGVERRAFVIVESELDAIAAAGASDLAGSVATGSSHAKPDKETYEILKGAVQILNALDYDTAGSNAMKWWDEQFPETCRRWPVPQGKDPGEAYKMGTDLNLWIKAGLPPVLTVEEKRRETKHPSSKLPQSGMDEKEISAKIAERGLSPLIFELWQLLRRNPSVKIINTPDRFAVERNGKHIGGRIHDLVYREKEVNDFIFKHEAEKIDGSNLIS